MMDIDPEKLRSPFLVGMLGALVALRSAPGDSWPVRAVNVLSGALIAGFLSPAACEFFSLTSQAMQSAMAFACGLFGMNLASAAFGWIKNLQLADMLPWLRRKD